MNHNRQAFGENFFGRVPVSFRQTDVPDDVLRYLQATLLFQASSHDNLDEAFTKCVDHPDVPGHIYYEGYFHGSWDVNGTFKSINPRLGMEMDKPVAPPELMAFCEAIRRCNIHLTNDIIASLQGNNSCQARMLCSLLQQNRHFADLAVQIHFGDEITSPHIGFHVDAPNSILHMAISLNGSRVLHWSGAETRDGTMSEHEDAQKAGDVYLSSPSAFRHGVQYPSCDWKERTVAIMCRFLLTEHDLVQLYDSSPKEWPSIYEVVSASIARHEFVMPSMQEVETVAAEKKKKKKPICVVC